MNPFMTDYTAELKAAQRDVVAALREAGAHVANARPTGSAYYGAADPNDYDVLVLVGEIVAESPDVEYGLTDLETLSAKLAAIGWADCADLEGNTSGGDTDDHTYYETWIAARKGQHNMIVTDDLAFFYRHAAATELVAAMCAEQQRVLPKGKVIELFRWVRDGHNDEATS